MVGSINAVGDTFTTYMNAAKAIGSNEVLVDNFFIPIMASIELRTVDT